MAKASTPQKPAKPAKIREDRLKAALKANMARRKAQARARESQDPTAPETGNGPNGPEQESR
ncbi:MAG: hypothetical protein ACJAVM_003407 [Sulfitobacter sp.]|jgi:hypothetical protein